MSKTFANQGRSVTQESRHFLGKPRTLTSEVEASEWILLTLQTPELSEPAVVAHPSLVRANTPALPPSWVTVQNLQATGASFRTCPTSRLLGLELGLKNCNSG